MTAHEPAFILLCRPDNDLYLVLLANGVACARFATVEQALAEAPRGSGLLLLADEYPRERTPVDADLVERAASAGIRLYVEFPAWLPDIELGETAYQRTGRYGSVIERTVVASDAFGPSLPRGRILMVHDCHYVPVAAEHPHLVLGQVEGYDTAVYGLPSPAAPLLFEHPRGGLLVATTKLSQFVTGRYAPTEAWGPVWRMILGWLNPSATVPDLAWTPTVRPTYGSSEVLPTDAERIALERGVAYYGKSRLYIHPDWPLDTGIDPLPADWPSGDGTHGIGECYISKRIFLDGGQSVSRRLRTDCNLEAAMGLACGAAVLGIPEHAEMAQKLNQVVFRDSVISQGPRADPASPSYGLLGGATDSPWCYWGDDNARALLGAIACAGLLRSDCWTEAIVRVVLANFRTTSVNGFRLQMVTEDDLQRDGWRSYFTSDYVDLCPHMQCWLWTTFLWLYHQTRYAPLLDRARSGLRTLMAAFPGWRLEANRVETERCRMLLPLAWLVRADDTLEHRAWLDTIARDLIARQDASGAIPQEPGTVVASNDGYGTEECALVHAAGDPATDALYAINFGFVGMHEAAAATGSAEYARSTERMAGFFTRTQTRSDTHPELDGTWYRGFDFRKWDYWASDGDWGWGVWTNEIGWTHSWVTAMLAMRQTGANLWDLCAGVEARGAFDALRDRMLEEFA